MKFSSKKITSISLILELIAVGWAIYLLMSFFKLDLYKNLSIVIISLLSIVLFDPSYKKIKNIDAISLGFVVGLFTTVVGVYLGVSLANDQQEEKETDRLIKIIQILQDDIDANNFSVREVANYFDSSFHNMDTIPIKSKTLKLMLSEFTKPTYLDFYFGQESFVSALAPNILFSCVQMKQMINQSADTIKSYKDYIRLGNLKFYSNMYIRCSSTLSLILALQVEILEKDISQDVARERLIKIYSSIPFQQQDSAHLSVIWYPGNGDDTTLIK